MSLIATDGEVADGVAVAVKDSDKGVYCVADRQPAALAALHRKIIVLAVRQIQAVPLVAAARPDAAIVIGIKVQIPHQLIAHAVRVGTAQAVPHRFGAGLVARARQVVAHVVQHEQAVDLDQAIAIAVSHGRLRLRDPR